MEKEKMITLLMSVLFVLVWLAMFQPGEIAASNPSKVACKSFGLPPLLSCNVGRKLAEIPGTPCFGCYGCNGNGRRKNVKDLLRHNWNLLQGKTTEEMVEILLPIIPERDFFRWFWNGDCYNKELADAILILADLNPSVPFLAFTREAHLLEHMGKLPNLAIRQSMPRCNQKPTGKNQAIVITKSGKPTPGSILCPGDCSKCRFCWSSDPRTVYMPWHGDAIIARACRKAGMNV